ncbi:MAG: histidinol-phosphatase [Bacteroidales bacterium]|jgi:histidinol-phosphatase (PHP family)|nr:histidinol-phosphatase [Bacteroidales bacterium]MDY0054064.1 histidinol-phosphatase [Bacteroidales bacterium]
MLKFNYHSHSSFCDGKNTLEEMVISAIEKKLSYFGFSAHSPVPFENDFALKEEDIKAYLDETIRLKEKYKDEIKLFTSMEFDYIPGLCENLRQKAKEYNLDYIISSVHLVVGNGLWFIDGSKQESFDKGLEECFSGDIKKGVKAFYSQTNEMITKEKPDIIGHFDKVKMHNKDRYFLEDEAWYEALVLESLNLIKENNIICEINTRGLYKGRSKDYFPQRRWIKEMAKLRIPITISTDSHNKDEVDKLFAECWEDIKQLGHKEVWYFDGTWKTISL